MEIDLAAITYNPTDANKTDDDVLIRFRLYSADPRARRLERAVAWRCRALALPYGDQGLLLDLLEAAGFENVIALNEGTECWSKFLPTESGVRMEAVKA